MDFKGQYLTYEDYTSLGGTLDETSFNLLEFECRRKIDERTQNRLKNIDSENIPQEVKLCINNMISNIEKYSEVTSEVKNVASENTDGYSISYLTPAQIKEVMENKDSEINELITTYLYGVIVNNEHVLYLGVK